MTQHIDQESVRFLVGRAGIRPADEDVALLQSGYGTLLDALSSLYQTPIRHPVETPAGGDA